MKEKDMEWKRDRIEHEERQCGQPWANWDWKRFPSRRIKSEMKEEDRLQELKAEFETDEDLNKPIPQLVCEFNLQIPKLSTGATEERIILIAQKRMVAMMAQVAMKNDEVSDNIFTLTRRMTWFTVAIFFLGIVGLAVSIFSYVCPVRTLP